MCIYTLLSKDFQISSSDFPADAYAQLAENDEECTLSVLDHLVHGESQYAAFTPQLKDTILALIHIVHDLKQPASAIPKVTSFSSPNSPQPFKTCSLTIATCYVY